MISSISFCVIRQSPGEEIINRTIASILRQRIPGREILVWGDLSGVPDIRVFPTNGWNVTGELNRIRNLLCLNATKDFVALLDDHVELGDGWYDAIKEADYLDIIGSRIVTNKGTRAIDWAYQVKLGSKIFPYPLAYDEWTTKAYVSGLVLLRKRAWKRIHFNEKLVSGENGNVDLCCRATNAGFRVGVLPQAEAKYSLGESTATTYVTFEQSRDTVLAFKRTLAAGNEAFNSRDYMQALANFTKASELIPDDAETLSLKGWVYYFMARYQSAIELFDKAIAVDASNDHALRGRGWALLQSGAYTNAVNDLVMAVKLVNPLHRNDWLEAMRGLAWSHYHYGSFDEAIKHFRTLLEKSNSYETGLLQDVHRGLGWCYYRMKSFGESAAHFNNCLAVTDPKQHVQVAEDARHGLELAKAGDLQDRAPVNEHNVAVVADLSEVRGRVELHSRFLTRARRLALTLKRVLIKVVNAGRGSRDSAIRFLRRI